MLATLAALALAPPNVVLGIGEVGAYGQKRVPTPNLDRLAREGTTFTRFDTARSVRLRERRCGLRSSGFEVR